MHIKKKLIIFVLTFAMILSVFPILSVHAADNDLKIISESPITAEQAKKWARDRGATETFISLADLYFEYYQEHGNVNPAIAYVQAAKETGYGKFGGVIDENYHNPCGLKIAAGGSDTDPKAHKIFNSWDEGVQAHLDHLALYAGGDGYPRDNTFDERHFRSIKGTATTLSLLGGKWAPSPTYGQEVNQVYNNLLSYSGVKVANNTTDKNDDKNSNNDAPVPDPTVSENKPDAPNVDKVIEINDSDKDNKSRDITSTTTGWKSEKGKWYYFGSPGVISKGWIHPGYWYYMEGDGSMVTGLKLVDNKTYFFDNDGTMFIGWKMIDNHWYYFNADGTMATGWITNNGQYYYLYDTGAMAKGWINIDNAWYYLKDSGAMATGWIKSNGHAYYLDPASGRMTKKSNKPSTNNKTITIDAGHDYGKDGGASETIDGVTYNEVDLDLQEAVRLKTELEKRGYNVVMTRNGGERPSYGSLYSSLAHRVDTANNSNSDLFISIHHNAASAAAKGVETYYSVHSRDAEYGGGLNSDRVEKSKELAKAINDNIANRVGTNNRGAKSDASANVGSLFVLRNTNMPAVLVEVGFITNPEEAIRTASSDGQQKVAEAIADAIASTLY